MATERITGKGRIKTHLKWRGLLPLGVCFIVSIFRPQQFRLLAMGYALAFIPTNFELFASVADPIIQNLIINLVVFCASGLTVLLLVGFIYMRIANKNLALCRALGMPKHASLRLGCCRGINF